jgi:hypothetical protein
MLCLGDTLAANKAYKEYRLQTVRKQHFSMAINTWQASSS